MLDTLAASDYFSSRDRTCITRRDFSHATRPVQAARSVTAPSNQPRNRRAALPSWDGDKRDRSRTLARSVRMPNSRPRSARCRPPVLVTGPAVSAARPLCRNPAVGKRCRPAGVTACSASPILDPDGATARRRLRRDVDSRWVLITAARSTASPHARRSATCCFTSFRYDIESVNKGSGVTRPSDGAGPRRELEGAPPNARPAVARSSPRARADAGSSVDARPSPERGQVSWFRSSTATFRQGDARSSVVGRSTSSWLRSLAVSRSAGWQALPRQSRDTGRRGWRAAATFKGGGRDAPDHSGRGRGRGARSRGDGDRGANIRRAHPGLPSEGSQHEAESLGSVDGSMQREPDLRKGATRVSRIEQVTGRRPPYGFMPDWHRLIAHPTTTRCSKWWHHAKMDCRPRSASNARCCPRPRQSRIPTRKRGGEMSSYGTRFDDQSTISRVGGSAGGSEVYEYTARLEASVPRCRR